MHTCMNGSRWDATVVGAALSLEPSDDADPPGAATADADESAGAAESAVAALAEDAGASAAGGGLLPHPAPAPSTRKNAHARSFFIHPLLRPAAAAQA